MRILLLALLTVMLVACSSSAVEEPVTTDDTMTPAPAPTEVITVLPEPTESPEPEPVPHEAKPEPIEADPEVMATMECEPLSEDLLDRMRIFFGSPTRSVQVEVGEGNRTGEIWWVVVLDSPGDDAYQWEELRRFLTDAPGITEGGMWIPLPITDTWGSVDWDLERLARGESALIKALECLGA